MEWPDLTNFAEEWERSVFNRRMANRPAAPLPHEHQFDVKEIEMTDRSGAPYLLRYRECRLCPVTVFRRQDIV